MSYIRNRQIINPVNVGVNNAVYKKPIQAWGSELKIVNCENFCDTSYKLYILPKVTAKIVALMDIIKDIEWAAYLVGNVVHTRKTAYITDLILPLSQYNTGGNVDDIVMDQSHKYIGVIHSHHSMGAFFSGPDDNTVNKNHDVSIVVSSNKGSRIASVVRGKTKCGSLTIDNKPDIRVFKGRTNLFDMESFKKEIENKIPHKKFSDIVRKPVVYQYPEKNEFIGIPHARGSFHGKDSYLNGTHLTRKYNHSLYDYNYDEDYNVESDLSWVQRFLGIPYKNESDDNITNYSEIMVKINSNKEFKEFVFKELINEKSLLETFKDVLISKMLEFGVLKKKGNTYNPKKAQRFMDRINQQNEKLGLLRRVKIN